MKAAVWPGSRSRTFDMNDCLGRGFSAIVGVGSVGCVGSAFSGSCVDIMKELCSGEASYTRELKPAIYVSFGGYIHSYSSMDLLQNLSLFSKV